VHRDKICPVLFPDDANAQEEYFEYLLATRFAPAGHPAYLPNDRRARSHCVYGQHSAALASYFNMNEEAIIKVLFVDEVGRRCVHHGHFYS
jgi:hypothetical protein